MTRTRRSVAVVGSGIGGCAAAALLSHDGRFEVQLFEKNRFVGGRFASFERDGFRLDIGCHVIAGCERGAIGRVFEALGEPSALLWHHLAPGAHVFRYEGRDFEFPGGLGAMGFSQETLERVSRFYADLLCLGESELEQLDARSVLQQLELRLEDPRVRMLFGVLSSVYFATRDFDTPLGELARCSGQIARCNSMGYPIGGTAAVPQALVRVAERHGARIHLGRAVDEILVSGGAARGVRLADGTEIAFDLVVSNVDVKSTMRDLVRRGHYPQEVREAAEGLEYSQAAGALKVALDRPFVERELVTCLGSDDLAGWDEALACGMVPDSVEFMMVSVVSSMDATACPPGRQLLVAGATARHPASPDERRAWKRAFLRGLERFFPGIGERTLWSVYTSPAEIAKLCGEEGCVVGLAQRVGQVGPHRPAIADPHVANLFHCSADTGLHGIGGELAADSALRLHRLLAG